MSDLIDRQAAIDALDEERKQRHLFNTAEDGLLEARRIINTLTPVQPEVLACGNGELVAQPEAYWIPVSERLPEIGKYVLCYLKSRRYFGRYRVCIYRAADKYINHPYFDFNENGFPDVIAWMPLPEPYKGDEKQSGKEGA